MTARAVAPRQKHVLSRDVGTCCRLQATARANVVRMTHPSKHAPPRDLTSSELSALDLFAVQHGAQWKKELLHLWRCCGARPILHALRNSHGPEWLESFAPSHGHQPAARAAVDAAAASAAKFRVTLTAADVATLQAACEVMARIETQPAAHAVVEMQRTIARSRIEVG